MNGYAVLASLPKAFSKETKAPLYARIDFLMSDEGEPLLTEIEMVEPELFFKMRSPEKPVASEPAVKMFCDLLESAWDLADTDIRHTL